MGNEMKATPLIVFIFGTCLLGQDAPPPLLGSSYLLPTPISVAPGQLVTLIMQGIDTEDVAITRAPAGTDLPTTLAAFR